MASCEACGTKAGFGKKLCEECAAETAQQRHLEKMEEDERLAEEARSRREQEAERQRLAIAAREQRYRDYIEGRLGELDALVANGVTPYLYGMISLSTESQVNGRPVGAWPDLTELMECGWNGWEAVGTIPITHGEGLQNTSYGSTSGTSWGGGIGGIVVGAHILMRLAITKAVLEARRDYVASLVGKDFRG